MCPDHEKLLTLWKVCGIRYRERMMAIIRRDCVRGLGCGGYDNA